MQPITERPIRFGRAPLTISGRIALTAGPAAGVGTVLCHPHPQFGGTMENNVVVGIAGVLQRRGMSTLRFDFRGVGESRGGYSGGEGEVEDVCRAVRALREQSKVGFETLAVVGYSFGAWVGCRAGRNDPDVDLVIAISPPLEMFDFEALAASEKTMRFICGRADPFCPVSDLAETVERHGESCSLEVVDGADHFWGGREKDLGERVADYLEGFSSE